MTADSRLGLPLIVFAVCLVAAVNLAALAGPDAAVLDSRLPDADAYLRLVRVLELHQGAGWFDTVTPRLAAPDGLSVHWTRPLDLLILLPALAAEALAGATPRSAILIAGILVSPVLHAAAAVAAAWGAQAIWPGRAAWYAVLLAVATPAANAYAGAGRADHHALILLALMLGISAALHALRPGGGVRPALLSGIAFGMGIWVSPEVLIGAAPLLAATGLASLIAADGRALATQGLRIATGMAMALALAIVVERPPTSWIAVEYDRVCVLHLALAILVAGVFAVARRVGTAVRMRRVALAGAAAMAASGALLLVFPGMLQGSFGQADDLSRSLLLSAIEEMQPLPLFLPGGAAVILAVLGGPPFAALLAMGLAAPGWRRDGVWAPALALGGALLAGLVAAFAARRFALDLAAPAAIGGAGLVGVILHGRWPRPEAVRALAAALVFFGLLGAPVIALIPTARGGAVPAAAAPACDPYAVVAWLAAEQPGVSAAAVAPILLAADLDIGPQLAWRTPYRGVGSSYHRGADAVADTFAVFEATDPQAARDVLARRGVALLLVCVARPEFGAGRALLPGAGGAGAPPDWLAPVRLPDHLAGYRLFMVAPP